MSYRDDVYEYDRRPRRRAEEEWVPARKVKKAKRKKRSRMSTPMKIVLSIFLTLVVIFAALVGVFFYYFGGLNTQPLTTDKTELGIGSGVTSDSRIVNIALFGVDSRNDTDEGRSDAIIILTVDQRHNKIKMTSILRDSRLKIEGHNYNKAAHAYAYGGPTLAINMLNQNFKLDIQEYVTVNFGQLEDIINAIGGVDLNITAAEQQAANVILESMKMSDQKIRSNGDVHLNGAQAMAYSRIRKIDSDAVRSSRQQKVLMGLMEQCKDMSLTQYPDFIRKLLPMVETSLTYGDIFELAPIMTKSPEIVQNVIPGDEDNATGGMYDGAWYWRYDTDAAAERLHTFIYEE